jgi:hypothetical protein
MGRKRKPDHVVVRITRYHGARVLANYVQQTPLGGDDDFFAVIDRAFGTKTQTNETKDGNNTDNTDAGTTGNE